MDETFTLTGRIRLIHDEFSKIPRGQISLKIDQLTAFKKDQYTHFKDLVFLFTKDISRLGETMVYKITEQDIADDKDAMIKYDTFYYDVFIEL